MLLGSVLVLNVHVRAFKVEVWCWLKTTKTVRLSYVSTRMRMGHCLDGTTVPKVSCTVFCTQHHDVLHTWARRIDSTLILKFYTDSGNNGDARVLIFRAALVFPLDIELIVNDPLPGSMSVCGDEYVATRSPYLSSPNNMITMRWPASYLIM